jgi:hypothetical protein
VYFLGLIQLERGFRGGKIEVMAVILCAAAGANKPKLPGRFGDRPSLLRLAQRGGYRIEILRRKAAKNNIALGEHDPPGAFA